eukprot:3110558-Alexandrium_andersonii.AAC.1
MSASLVGSEMCIRDRASSARVPEATATTSAPPQSWLTTAGTEPCTKGPVSYTHLTLPTICSV